MCEFPLELKLSELAERSGIPARTIRLYLSMGLLSAPLRMGRNAAYGAAHLEGLEKIRALQRSGLTLSQVGVALAGREEDRGGLPGPGNWREYELAPDVRVMLHADALPARMRVLQEAALDFMRRVNPAPDKHTNNERNQHNE